MNLYLQRFILSKTLEDNKTDISYCIMEYRDLFTQGEGE